MSSAQEFDRLLQRILSDSKYNQLKSIMGKEDLTKYGEKFFVTNSTSFRGTSIYIYIYTYIYIYI